MMAERYFYRGQIAMSKLVRDPENLLAHAQKAYYHGFVGTFAGAAGCAVISASNASYGEPFNAAGGGVFAMLWDHEGLRFCKS